MFKYKIRNHTISGKIIISILRMTQNVKLYPTMSLIVTRPAAQQQHRVCLGWGGWVGGFLPIIKSLPTQVEAELGCDNRI